MGFINGICGLILDNVAEGIILCDEKLNCIYLNNSIKKLFDSPTFEPIGRPIGEVLSSLRLQTIADHFPLALSGKSVECEISVLQSDFSTTWLKVKIAPLSVESRHYVIAYLYDISHEKFLPSQSSKDETRLNDLFFNNPIPMWIYDLETLEILAVNDAAIKHYGYSRDEFLTMTIKDIRPQEDVLYFLENVSRATEGAGRAGIRRHKKKDGTIIFVEILSHTIDYRGRRAEVVSAYDVTQQLREHNALIKSEELFRLVWEYSPAGLRLADENGIIVKVNKAYCDIVGKPREELEGKPIGSVYSPEIATKIQEQYLKLFKARNFPRQINDSYTLWNGRKAWFEVFNSFFETEGDVPLLLSLFTDFSKIHEAIEMLARSELRYRTLAENISDVICVLKNDLTISDITPSVFKFLGYSDKELVGEPIEKFLTQNSFIEFKNKLLSFQFAEDKSLPPFSKTLELEFIRKDFMPVWVEVRFNQIQIPEEKQTRILCAMRDITERRRIQSIMRLQSTAIESAGNAVIITTNDGTIVWANHAFLQLTGYDIEEIIGKKPSILKSGRHNDQFYKELWETINSGRIWRGEIINKRKDGSIYIEDMTITPVFNETHHITHFVAIKSDITKRKELEQELRILHKRFELIFNSSPAGIAIVTLRDCRFIEVNQSFLQITGYNKDDIIGYSADELKLFENVETCQKALENVRYGGAVHNQDINIKTKNGNIRNVLISAERIALGIEDCAILIFNDITDKKLLEEQLRHSQRLESIGTLAGGVAHDFNNILTVIQGHASLLIMNPLIPPELQDSIKQIADAAERASTLTRQLLTFSRKQKPEPKLININTVIENLTKMLKRLIGEHIALECSLQTDVPLILADIGMMEQMIMNLAVNARDAMPKGGNLKISTKTAFIPANRLPKRQDVQEGEYIIVSVKDTGHGIKPEDLPKIFEPFFTTKGVGKGTGLGLAMVQNIVYQHKGWITVDSVPGKGTEFTIFLPAAHPNDSSKSPSITEPAQWKRVGGETILFVEDDDKSREISKAVLDQFGYNVLTAQDAIQALELWRKYKDKIVLLLTDVILPRGINGKQLAEQLCSEKPTLKVILTTAYNPELTNIEFAELKKWLFLQKPYLPSALVNIVRQSLDVKINNKN